jgi:proteasome accessory factor C
VSGEWGVDINLKYNKMPKHLKILKFILLLNSPYRRSLDELCERLDIDERTLYRYIKDLKLLGMEFMVKNKILHYSNSGEIGNVFKHVLAITSHEALLLNRAIELVDAGSAAKEGLRKKLGLFDSDRVIDNLVDISNDDKIKCLHEAIRCKLIVYLNDYTSGNSNTVGMRMIEPFEFKNNFKYIMAYDIDSGANRLFRISRCKSITVTSAKWCKEAKHESLPTDVFRICGLIDKPILLELSLMAFNLLIEEYPESEKYIEHGSDCSRFLRCSVAGYEGVGRFCLGLPDHVKILESDSLKKYIDKRKKCR